MGKETRLRVITRIVLMTVAFTLVTPWLGYGVPGPYLIAPFAFSCALEAYFRGLAPVVNRLGGIIPASSRFLYYAAIPLFFFVTFVTLTLIGFLCPWFHLNTVLGSALASLLLTLISMYAMRERKKQKG